MNYKRKSRNVIKQRNIGMKHGMYYGEIYPMRDGNTHFGISMLTVTRDLASRIPPRWHTAEIFDESNHE